MPERRLDIVTFFVSYSTIDCMDAWIFAHARISSRFAVPSGRFVFDTRRCLAPIVMGRTAIIAFFETASFASRAARPTDLRATPRTLEVRSAGLTPRTSDPRGSHSSFALLVPPPSIAHVAPIDFITHPAAAWPNHSRAEWAVSSTVPSRPPATAAPTLAGRTSLRRLYSLLCGTERLQGRRGSRRWAFRATLMLHAVMRTTMTFRVFAQLHALIRATVPGGT